MKKYIFILLSSVSIFIISCNPDTPEPTTPKLIFKFKFDSTQERLNNFGNLAVMPDGHKAQTPLFNQMSAHYIE
ncbi:MAG TPA: hypothetical protein PLF48_10690, partial [Chitinophagales bacterium]|nr:hypothetical protein [Chitinophagales bacterium]